MSGAPDSLFPFWYGAILLALFGPSVVPGHLPSINILSPLHTTTHFLFLFLITSSLLAPYCASESLARCTAPFRLTADNAPSVSQAVMASVSGEAIRQHTAVMNKNRPPLMVRKFLEDDQTSSSNLPE